MGVFSQQTESQKTNSNANSGNKSERKRLGFKNI